METLFTPTLDEALQRAGMHLNGREPEPGRFMRFATNGSSSDRAGWIRVFPDGAGAVFGCWRAGESFAWQRRNHDQPPPTEQERSEARARAEAARREAERERQRVHNKAAEDAQRIWSECQRVGSHPYLTRKGIKSHGARVDAEGRLVLPVHNGEGVIRTLQFIWPEPSTAGGTRRQFLPDGEARGGRLALGPVSNGAPIVLAEGFATGASIRESTQLAVVVAFSGSNLERVAVDLRKRYPESRLIIAGDRDAGGQGAKYADAARVACRPAIAVYPAFADARQNGDWNDLHRDEGVAIVKQQIDAAVSPPSRFRLLLPSELAELPPMRWRVRDVLPESGLAAVFGPSGSGKSFLVLDMAMAVARGVDWFGHRVTAAHVVYCALEGEAGIAGRMAAYFTSHDNAPPNRIRCVVQRFNLLEPADVTELANAIRAAGASGGVLILDTLNRAASGMDENDSKDMGRAIEAAKQLQTMFGGLVVLVHHTGKDITRGLRGHSSLHAALDAAIEVSRECDVREWRMHKVKDGEDGANHPFRLHVVDVGVDEDGPVTSCVVEAEVETPRRKRTLLPKSSNQKIVWDALGEPFKTSPHYGKGGAPPSRPCITLETAVEQTRTRLPVETKRQTERARAAIEGLVSRGLLEFREGWLWCA